MQTIQIHYEPNPKQVEFHKSAADECIYGGAKGGGKSFALVMEALAYGLEHAGATLYLFRQTYDDLEANIIMEWQRQVPGELYKYNAGKYFARLINGSVVYFRYIRSYDDAARYRGRSIDWIGIDELTEHEEHSIQELMSCLRSPQGFPPRFRATCNPGGIGHNWVKARYILSTGYGERIAKCPETGNSLQFIPATVYDNTVLMENDPAYVRRLENLPEVQRQAYLMGNWDVFAGQYYPEWDAKVHVIERVKIPDWWRRFRSLDYGLDTTACYWYAVDSQGRAIAYRELYEPDLSLSDAAKKIVEMTDEDISYTVASPDLWNRRQDTGRSGVDAMREAGLKGLVKANDRRIPGWRELREWLKVYEDEHGLSTAKIRIVGDACPNLIRTLPTLIHCDRNPEDVSDKVEDHGCLVEGTLITTSKGDVPIEAVTPGDAVLTRNGWRSVTDAAMTGQNVALHKVTTSDGRELIGTSNHPVYVKGKGFVRLDSLRYGDMLNVIEYRKGEVECKLRLSRKQKPVPKTVAHVVDFSLAGTGTVYNLEVEGEPEYYANGILVHNCESLRYFVMSRPGVSIEPEVKRARLWRRRQKLKPVVSDVTNY